MRERAKGLLPYNLGRNPFILALKLPFSSAINQKQSQFHIQNLLKEIFMYLSEEICSEIRKCLESNRSTAGINPGKNTKNHIKKFHDTEIAWKVSQILFDVRDGKEVFTPF